LRRIASTPLINQGEKRDRDCLVVYVRLAGLRRQQLQAPRKPIDGFAERISTEHLKSYTNVFRVRELRGINCASFQRAPVFCSRFAA
jgi:hypothetical protein